MLVKIIYDWYRFNDGEKQGIKFKSAEVGKDGVQEMTEHIKDKSVTIFYKDGTVINTRNVSETKYKFPTSCARPEFIKS